MDLDELKAKLENKSEVVYPTGDYDKRERMAEPTDENSGLNIPVVMPRFSEITTESDDKAFSWILQNDTNADHTENNSDMIRRLVHKYNDLIKYLNGA